MTMVTAVLPSRLGGVIVGMLSVEIAVVGLALVGIEVCLRPGERSIC